ncbi:kinase-like domain-containing protein [Lentinula raphanica]|nr:kinase-like domain-containing protein [Lentinula raphanica]
MAFFQFGIKRRGSPLLFSSTRTLHHVSTPRASPRRFAPPSLDNIEEVEAYWAGGFHPISIGDCFAQGRYRVLHKLGYGGSSTVWLARDREDSGKLVTLKVLRADSSSTRNPALIIPDILRAASLDCSGIQLVDDHFFVEGPNGSHLSLVSSFAGPSIPVMLDCPGRVAGSRRLRSDLARKVAKQIAMSLYCMHRTGVVHGDITTSNILFSLSPHVITGWADADVYNNLGRPETEQVRSHDGKPGPASAPTELVAPIDNANLMNSSLIQESVMLADFGQSYMVASPPKDYTPATLPNYYSPEARFDGRASFEADIWALGCTIFEIRSGFPLFSSFLGSDADILKQTVEILGRLPDPWWETFEERALWFEDDGEPSSIQDQESAGVFLYASKSSVQEQLQSIGTQDEAPLSDEGSMFEKPGIRPTEREVDLLADLLGKMLKYRPEDRIGMQEVLVHPWFTVLD